MRKERVWRYQNNTTGASTESTSLSFLLQELMEVKGIPVSPEVGYCLVQNGQVTYDAMSDEGELVNVTISAVTTHQDNGLFSPFNTNQAFGH